MVVVSGHSARVGEIIECGHLFMIMIPLPQPLNPLSSGGAADVAFSSKTTKSTFEKEKLYE